MRYRPKTKYRIYLFPIFLFCFYSLALGQQKDIDSLKSLLLKKQIADTTRVNLLNAIAFDYYSVNISQLKFYSNQALALAEKLNYAKGEALACKNIGLGYLGSNADPRALIYFEKALSIYNNQHDNESSARVLNNIGYYYGRVKDHGQEQDYLKQAYAKIRSVKKPEIEAVILGNIGNSYEAANQLEKAQNYYNRSIAMLEKLQMVNALIAGYSNMASVKLKLNKLNEAVFYANKVLELIKGYKNFRPKDLAVIYITLGKVYFKQMQFEKARSYFDQSFVIANKIGNAEDISEVYRSYYLLDSLKGDYKNALKNYYLYDRMNDSLTNVNKSHLLALYQVKYDLQKRDAENQRLKVQEENSRITIDHQFTTQAILLVGLIIIGLGTIHLIRYNKQIKTQNNTINEQNKILESNSVVKDKLFSVISHDLRSPVTQVIGLLNLWEEGEMNQEEMSVLTPAVKSSIMHTLELLDNLLIWSKNQLQGFNFNPVQFDLRILLEDNIRDLQGLIGKKNLKIDNAIPFNTSVEADKEMIKIVLRNLISNAIKFTPQNGDININSQRDGKFIVIAVEDTGIGIKEADMEKIFSFTSHTTLGTANEKGTGIGLKICKDFIELNNGRIWMESKENVGSKFYIALPVEVSVLNRKTEPDYFANTI